MGISIIIFLLILIVFKLYIKDINVSMYKYYCKAAEKKKSKIDKLKHIANDVYTRPRKQSAYGNKVRKHQKSLTKKRKKRDKWKRKLQQNTIRNQGLTPDNKMQFTPDYTIVYFSNEEILNLQEQVTKKIDEKKVESTNDDHPEEAAIIPETNNEVDTKEKKEIIVDKAKPNNSSNKYNNYKNTKKGKRKK